jgi:hypothetical protein
MVLARDFSRQHRIIHFASIGSASGLRHHEPRICLRLALHPYPRTTNAWAGLPSCVIPSLDYYQQGSRDSPAPPEGFARSRRLALKGSSWANQSGYGNINPLSIDYACRPRLRSRLTLGGLACPRNPWSSGGRVSHPSFATHACILTRVASTTGSPRRFTAHTTLPYPSTPLARKQDPDECHGFGGVLEPRYIVGAEPLDQ